MTVLNLHLCPLGQRKTSGASVDTAQSLDNGNAKPPQSDDPLKADDKKAAQPDDKKAAQPDEKKETQPDEKTSPDAEAEKVEGTRFLVTCLCVSVLVGPWFMKSPE